ncbi:MAG TPA: RHS repeat-associated core domain-containing protein [Gemmatimonadaceae bacterium]|nr:RHS repeat-associated core domain-containing protein [Gemmatimonadaceae bacterium]
MRAMRRALVLALALLGLPGLGLITFSVSLALTPAPAAAQCILCGGDTTPPSGSVSPSTGSFSSPTLAVTIEWCDDESPLNSAGQSVTLNGTDVTSHFSYSAGSNPDCAGSGPLNAELTGTVTLVSGTNTLSAHICDSSDNCANRSGSYTYTPPPPTYTVAVTPDGQAVSADANSSTNTQHFTVKDNGNTNASYTLTCTNTMGTCSAPGSVGVGKNGDTATVTVTYHAGAAGTTGTVTLTATEGTFTDAGSVHVTAYSHTVAVTPTTGSDGHAVTATANTTNSASFTIKNTGTQQASYSLTTSCPGTTSGCSLSGVSTPVTLAANQTVTGTVTYGAGADGATGSTHLTATYTGNSAVHDAGWVNWTAAAPCQVTDAKLSPCTLATKTVLTSATGIRDTVTLTNQTGFPLSYSVACQRTGAVSACTGPAPSGLNANASGPIVVTVTAGASEGDGTVHVVITTGGDKQVSATGSFEVLSPTSVAVTTNTQTTHINAGDSGTHGFTVRNAGSLTATYATQAVCTGIVTQCTPSASQVTLGGNASTTVSVSYVASLAGGSGTVGLKATHIRSGAVTSSATAPVAEDRTPAVVATDVYSLDYDNTALCAVSCFNATASYTTPAYTSLDIARAVTLSYSSATAAPRPVVQVGVTDPSATPADQYIVQLKEPDGNFLSFANGANAMVFATGDTAEQLAVQLDPTAPPATKAYPVTLIVTSRWTVDTVTEEALVPLRLLVDNEQASPYGAGWSIAGLQHLTFTGDSILLTDGTGSAYYFQPPSCPSGCSYRSPAGDFTTLTKLAQADSIGTLYERRTPDGTTIGFLSDGRMQTVTDRFGNRTFYGYETGSTKLARITDPVGQVTTFGYDAAGMLSTITDPMGRVTHFTITNGNLTQIKDPAGGTALAAVYDTQHRLIALTDRGGHTTHLGYDYAGKIAADTLPAIMVNGQPVAPVVHYRAPERAELIDPASGAGTAANPAVAAHYPDINGIVTDPRGDSTRYWLTRFGSPWQIVQPLGRVTNFSHDNSAHVISVVTPSHHIVAYTWNGPDLTEVQDQTTGQTVHYSYESTYHQVTSVSGDATPVTNYWSAGKLDSTVAGGAMSHFTYDSFGRLLESTDPAKHVTTMSYASTGLRNRTLVSAAGRTTAFTRDSYGRVVATTAPGGEVTSAVYDVLNRVQRTVGPLADTTRYTYGDSLHLTQLVDPLGQSYRSHYTALGEVDSTTDPAGHAATMAYDVAGQVIKTIDRAGHVVTASYDALGQVTAIVADGDTTHYHTDPAGGFVATSNAASTDTVRFDAAGRPTTEVTVRGTQRYVRTSSYNRLGQRTALAASGAWTAAIGYAYDAVTHQLDTLTDLAGGKTVLGYNADRLVSTTRLPTTSGLTVSRSYPSTHLTSLLSYSEAALNGVLGTSFAETPNGQLSQRIPVDQPGDGSQVGHEFRYDSLGRVVGSDDYTIAAGTENLCGGTQLIDADGNPCIVPAPGAKDSTNLQTFAYDKVGNRTDSDAVVAVGNRLVRFDGDSLVYDLDGNLTHRWQLGGGFDQRYGWNSLGQLVEVVTNGDTVRFTYDGFGRRATKSGPGVFRSYLYDGENLLAELDGAADVVVAYTNYPGVDQPHSMRFGGQTYYYATERPNNVVGLISSSNTLVDQYSYTPFGMLADSSGTVPNSLRFGARVFDGETGLYYNRARYYDPRLGRFLSEDPIGLAGGINPYVYAGDDPLDGWDPFGLCDPNDDLTCPAHLPGMTITDNGAADGGDPLAGLRPSVPRLINGSVGSGGGDGGSSVDNNAESSTPKWKSRACVLAELDAGASAAEDVLFFFGVDEALEAARGLTLVGAIGETFVEDELEYTAIPTNTNLAISRASIKVAGNLALGGFMTGAQGERPSVWSTVRDFIPLVRTGYKIVAAVHACR